MASEAEIERLAAALAQAWKAWRTIPLPAPHEAPSSRAQALAVQDRMADLIGQPCVGWKVGAASKAVQRMEGLDGPTIGRLFADRVFASPARLPAGLAGYRAECEFAFRFRGDVPARSTPYRRSEIVPLMVLHPGIELAGSRYAPDAARKPTTYDGLADNGISGAFVFGAAIEDWSEVPFEHLAVEARIDDGAPIEVLTGIYRRDAVEIAVETVNELSARGIGFKAGDYLATGSVTVPTPLGRGQSLRARFAGLGEVAATVA